jgi:hypothetical protein
MKKKKVGLLKISVRASSNFYKQVTSKSVLSFWLPVDQQGDSFNGNIDRWLASILQFQGVSSLFCFFMKWQKVNMSCVKICQKVTQIINLVVIHVQWFFV